MQYAIIKPMDIDTLKYGTKYTIDSKFVCIDNLFRTRMVNNNLHTI